MSNFIINAFADESDSNISGQIDALKRNSLSGLEIRGVDGNNIGDISIEKAIEVNKALTDNGLKVYSIGSRLGKIKITDDFGPHLDEFKRTLELAKVFDAKFIRLFSFFIPKDQNPEIFKNKVFEQLSIFVETAKGSDIMLCHENEKGIYGDIAKRCLEIHNEISELGCIFDPANYIQCGQDTLEAWNMLEDKVTYLHIKDAFADGTIVPAGKGVGNLKLILDRFASNGGKFLTIEPHLTVFKGLSDLEQDDNKTTVDEYNYPSNEAAFDAAVNALKELIK